MLGICDNGNCGRSPPPPDSILSMPPPPLPSFLLPKTAVVAAPLSTNDSHPCFTSLMCDPSPQQRESTLDFVELSGENSMENTWLFVLISSGVGVLILGGLLAIILLKCRDTLFASCNFSYHDSNMKQVGGVMTGALGESTKTNPFMAGGILYPCTANAAQSRDTLQSQLTNDSRLLWATLTPHGTRHFISDYNGPDSGHYEVVDYRLKAQQQQQQQQQQQPPTYREYVKRTPIKSFENNGFVDYDYEDPTPLMDSYHDDLDSGYQEPQEIMANNGGSMQRVSPRPHVSSPTRIDHPNMAPLNYYPSTHRAGSSASSSSVVANNTLIANANSNANGNGIVVNTGSNSHSVNNSITTLNRKATLNRRISDASSSTFGTNSNM